MADADEYDLFLDKSEFSEEHLEVLSAAEQAEQIGGGGRRRRSRSATPSTTPTRLRAKVTPTTKAGFVTTNALQRRANLIQGEDSPTPTGGVDEELTSTADISLPPTHEQVGTNADPYSFVHRAQAAMPGPYVYPPAPMYMPQQHLIYHRNEHRTPEPVGQPHIGVDAHLRTAHESSQIPEPARGHVVDAFLRAPPYGHGDAAHESSHAHEPARGHVVDALLRAPPSGLGYRPGNAVRESSRTPEPGRGHLSKLEMQALLRGPPSHSGNASGPVDASHKPSRTPEPIGAHVSDGRMPAMLHGLPKPQIASGPGHVAHMRIRSPDILGGDVGIQAMHRGPHPRPGNTSGPGDGSHMPSRTPDPLGGDISDIEMQALLRGPPPGSHNASRESSHAPKRPGSVRLQPPITNVIPPRPDHAHISAMSSATAHLQPPVMNVIPPTPDQVHTGDADQRPAGRRSDSVNEIVREGFQRLDKEFASLAEAAGYATSQDLINKYIARHRSATSWNMYQEYFKEHEATEMERLKDVKDVPKWKGDTIPNAVRSKCHDKFKEAYPETFFEILEAHRELKSLDPGVKTLQHRTREFRRIYRELASMSDRAAARYGFEVVILMCGSSINHDQSLADIHATEGAKEFFSVRFCADDDKAIGQFKSHVFDRVSRAITVEDFGDGKDGVEKDGKGIEGSSKDIQKDEPVLRELRSQFYKSAAAAGLDLPANQLPWMGLVAILIAAGYILLNYPDIDTPWPNDKQRGTKSKGIAGLHLNAQTRLLKQFKDKDHPLSFQGGHSPSDLRESRKPVFIGAPPHSHSVHTHGRRKFANGNEDREGPERLDVGTGGSGRAEVEESVETHRKDSRSDEAPSKKIKTKVEKTAKQTGKGKTNSRDLFVDDSDHEFIELSDTDESSTPSPPLTRHQARRLENTAVNDMEDSEVVLPLKRPRDDGHTKSKPKRPKVRRTKSKAIVNSSDNDDGKYGDDKGDGNDKPKGNTNDKGKHVLKDSETTEVEKAKPRPKPRPVQPTETTTVATSTGQSVASSESEIPFVPKPAPIQQTDTSVATSADQSGASSGSEVPFVAPSATAPEPVTPLVASLPPLVTKMVPDTAHSTTATGVKDNYIPDNIVHSLSPNMPVQHMAMAPNPQNSLPPPVQYGEQGWSTNPAQFQGYGYHDPQFNPYSQGYVPGPSNTYPGPHPSHIPGYWMQPPPHRGYHGGYSDQPHTAYFQGTEQPRHPIFQRPNTAIVNPSNPSNPSVPGPSNAAATHTPEDKA